MCGPDDRRVIERTGFDIDVFRMSRRGSEDRGAALWTEVTSEFATTITALRKTIRRSRGDPKLRDIKPNANIERATGAPPTVLAVAVVRRANGATIIICDASAKAPAGDVARHRISFRGVVSSREDSRSRLTARG